MFLEVINCKHSLINKQTKKNVKPTDIFFITRETALHTCSVRHTVKPMTDVSRNTTINSRCSLCSISFTAQHKTTTRADGRPFTRDKRAILAKNVIA